MSEAQAIELRISASAQQAIEELKKLSSAMTRIKTAVSKGLDFSKYSDGIAKLGETIRTSISEDAVARFERMAAAAEKLKGAGAIKVSGAAQAVQPIKAAMESAAGATGPLRSGLRNTSSEIVETASAASKASSGLKGLIERIREAGNAGKHASGGIGGLMKDFMRIAKYRALRTAIKEITDGFKTGVENVRQYSAAIGGDFARDMASASSALATMKNAIGAAVAPALQSLIPILNAVTSAVITAVNALNQLFSLLRGGGSWTRAKTVTESLDGIKKSAGGAGGAIKGLLADWDELNIIQSKGGGGGGGAAGLEYEDMFEEVTEFDERIKAIVSWLQEHMEIVKAAAEGILLTMLAWKLTNGFKLDIAEAIARIAKFALMWIGLTIFIYAAKKAISEFVDQWKNGIDWDNAARAILYSALAIAGLGIAFGKLGVGFGLIGFGIALVINPIKELIETGKLSAAAMFQLAIGVGALGGWIVLVATKSIPKAIKWFLGLALVAYGVVSAFQDVKEQLESGVNYDNFLKLFKDLKIAVLGLAVLFGMKGLGAGLIVSGLTEMIAPVKEFVDQLNQGKSALEALRSISDETFAQFETGVLELGIGISLLTGNWIPLAIAAVVDIVLWAVREWDEIVSAFKKVWEGIGTWVYNNVTMPVGNFFIDLANSVLETINTMLGYINSLFGTSYAMNELIPKIQPIEEQAKETAQIISGNSSEPKRKKNITGTATEEQLQGYTDTAKEAMDTMEDVARQQRELSEQFRKAVEGFDLSSYDNFEQAVDAINQRLKESASAMNAAKEVAEEAASSVEGYEDTIQGVADTVKTAHIDQPVIVKPIVTYDAPQQQDTIEFDVDTAGTGAAVEIPFGAKPELNVDSNAAEDLYDQIYKALGDYNVESPTADKSEYFDNLFDTMLKPFGEMKGLSDDQIGEMADAVYDSWIQYLFSEDWGTGVAGIMEQIQGYFDREKLEIPIENFSALKQNLENYENYYGRNTQKAQKWLDTLFYPTLKSNIDDALKKAGIELTDEAAESIYDNFREMLGKYFSTDDVDWDINIDDLIKNLKEMIETPIPPLDGSELTGSMANLSADVDAEAAKMESSVQRFLNALYMMNGITLRGGVGGTFRFNTLSAKPAYTFASGGFPTTGSMFIAREAGPEMVGTIGNRTAVANNDQIVSGVANGVAAGQAEQNALLRQQNDYLRKLLAKESTVKVEPSAAWGRVNKRSEELRVMGAGV